MKYCFFSCNNCHVDLLLWLFHFCAFPLTLWDNNEPCVWLSPTHGSKEKARFYWSGLAQFRSAERCAKSKCGKIYLTKYYMLKRRNNYCLIKINEALVCLENGNWSELRLTSRIKTIYSWFGKHLAYIYHYITCWWVKYSGAERWNCYKKLFPAKNAGSSCCSA